MTARILGLALLAVATLPAACREPPAPEATGAPPVWSIAHGETTVYLFGSAHMLTADAAWRSAAFEAALADAERLVFEVTPGPDMIAETQSLFEIHGRNPPGVTLSALLPPEDAARLRRVSERLGLPLAAIDAMRPWLAAQQIALAHAQSLGASAEWGVETQIMAEAGGREIEALETPAAQIATLAAMGPEDERRMLNAALHDAEVDPESPLRAEAAWSRGDSTAIEALSAAARAAVSPAFHDRVITQRNDRFTERALTYLTLPDDTLIIVGAAHLVGSEGIVARIRSRGFEVTGP